MHLQPQLMISFDNTNWNIIKGKLWFPSFWVSFCDEVILTNVMTAPFNEIYKNNTQEKTKVTIKH